MLTGITLENFKAFKEPQFIPIKPITLVFGPNSAGKSSIIHALAFLKHVSLTKGHCDPEEVDFGWSKVYLGSWQNLVHGHDASSTMRVTLHSTLGSICWAFGNKPHGPGVVSFTIIEDGIPIARGTNTSNKNINWEIEIHRSHPLIKSYKQTLWNSLLEKSFAINALHDQYSRHFDHWNEKKWRLLPSEFCDLNTKYNLYPTALLLDHSMLKCNFIDEEDPLNHFMVDSEKQSVLVDRLLLSLEHQQDNSNVEDVFDELFSRIEARDLPETSLHEDFTISHFHVGSHRELPQLDIRRKNLSMIDQASVWESLLEDGEKCLLVEEELYNAIGNRRLNLLNEAFVQLGIPYQVSKRRRREIVYRPIKMGDKSESTELDVSDEELVFIDQSGAAHPVRSLGSGVGFLVPVVVAISTIEARLISIEEPECHVHPSWQVALGDIVIQNTQRKCWDEGEIPFDEPSGWKPAFIIETHSEHLILRILRRIRETTEGKLAEWPESLRKASPNGIQPEDVAVLYVQPGESGVEVINMPITPDGDFSRPWPGGFFAERDNELF